MSKRKDIMLATMFTEKLFNAMPKPVFVQPKIEGDRLRVVTQYCNLNMLTSMCNERNSVPHIRKELMLYSSCNIELDGELYCHGMRHSEIRSIVSRTKNLHPDHKKMEYHIFDIVNQEPQFQRLNQLSNLVSQYKDSKYIKVVPTSSVRFLDELQVAYDSYLEQGYEGIIIRHPHAAYSRYKVTTLLKLKPRVSEDFKVVGVNEEETLDGVPKETFGSFILITKERELFNAGSGPTASQRDLLWKYRKELPGLEVKIRFQAYTRIRNVPKMMSIDKEWLTSFENACKQKEK